LNIEHYGFAVKFGGGSAMLKQAWHCSRLAQTLRIENFWSSESQMMLASIWPSRDKNQRSIIFVQAECKGKLAWLCRSAAENQRS